MAAPVMTGLRSNWCLQSVHAQTWMKNAAATQIETNSVNFSNIQFIQNGRETSWSPCNHIWLLRAGAAASRDELHGEVVLTSANPTRRPALVGGERPSPGWRRAAGISAFVPLQRTNMAADLVSCP